MTARIANATGAALAVLISGCCPPPCRTQPGTVTVTARCEPSGPIVLFHDDGRTAFARGPAEYRNPATGRWERLPPGAEVAFGRRIEPCATATSDDH